MENIKKNADGTAELLANDQEFLNKVVEQTEKIARGEEIPEAEKVKLNAKTLYPYQIVEKFLPKSPVLKKAIKEYGFLLSMFRDM